jgi:hypothetical protein
MELVSCTNAVLSQGSYISRMDRHQLHFNPLLYESSFLLPTLCDSCSWHLSSVICHLSIERFPRVSKKKSSHEMTMTYFHGTVLGRAQEIRRIGRVTVINMMMISDDTSNHRCHWQDNNSRCSELRPHISCSMSIHTDLWALYSWSY